MGIVTFVNKGNYTFVNKMKLVSVIRVSALTKFLRYPYYLITDTKLEKTLKL